MGSENETCNPNLYYLLIKLLVANRTQCIQPEITPVIDIRADIVL